MNKGKFAMTLVMLTIFVVMVGIATQYSAQARFMPFVIGIPGIALCLLQLYLDIRAPRAAKAAQDTFPPDQFAKAQQRIPGIDSEVAREELQITAPLPEEGEGRRELMLWACLLGLVAGIILFGFWPTIPVFITLFLRYFAGTSWRFSLALGVAGTTVLFLVFTQALGVILHNGFLTDQLLEGFAGR